MHLNYYFLSQIVNELKPIIAETWLAEIFTQQKDEMICAFAGKNGDFYVKCITGPAIQGFSFTGTFNRAKNNSIDLFKPAANLKVIDLFVTCQDRSFGILLENNLTLFFKMHGSRSNIVLYRDAKGMEEYHKHYGDIKIPYQSYARPELFSVKSLEENNFDILKLLPALGSEPAQWLEKQAFSSKSSKDKTELLCRMLETLHHPEKFYILNNHDKAALSFFESLPVLESKSSALEISGLFLKYYFTFTERNKLIYAEIKFLNLRKMKLEKYISSSELRLKELSENNLSEQTGHVIMANLHNIPPKSETIVLYDFYLQKEREIKLKKDLSPQKNAENYYRKGKNLAHDLLNIRKVIEQKTNELEVVIKSLSATDQHNFNRKAAVSDKPLKQDRSPYKKFEFEGYEIRVGKSSENNDELLQHHSHKNDLWLHARGFAGSHVIIRNIPGTAVPIRIIEKAASLAAYYSKGKSNHLCPVIVTERKFVRKAKGMAPGQVIVDKEKTIMVTPSEF